MRISRIDSALIEECARHYQVTARSVRTWRQKDDRRWREWIQKRAGEQSRLPSLDFVTEAAVRITPEDEESQALRRYVALTELCDNAIARGDQVAVVPLLRSAEQAHKLLQVVRENRLSFEERTKSLLPREEVLAYMNRTFTLLRGHIEILPDKLAHFIDPLDPARVALILEEEAHQILRAIHDNREATEKKFEAPLRSPAPAAENSALNSATLPATPALDTDQ